MVPTAGERWVHPAVEGVEAASDAWPVWRFRLVMLVITAIGVGLVALVYHYASGAADTGGGVAPAPSSTRSATPVSPPAPTASPASR